MGSLLASSCSTAHLMRRTDGVLLASFFCACLSFSCVQTSAKMPAKEASAQHAIASRSCAKAFTFSPNLPNLQPKVHAKNAPQVSLSLSHTQSTEFQIQLRRQVQPKLQQLSFEPKLSGRKLIKRPNLAPNWKRCSPFGPLSWPLGHSGPTQLTPSASPPNGLAQHDPFPFHRRLLGGIWAQRLSGSVAAHLGP